MNEPLAALRDAKRFYAGRLALNVRNLEIFEKDSIALLGHNGTGKSTLLRVLCGITKLSSGVLKTTASWRKSRIAYCPQNGGLYGDLTLSENMSLMQRRIPLTSAHSSYRDLLDAVDFGKASNVEIRKLSDGYRKLAMIATALAMSAEILVLDEPASDLHPTYIAKVANIIGRATPHYLAVIFAEHSNELIEIAKRKIELV
jgi:ABC-2 type transport system ATP-binding protein